MLVERPGRRPDVQEGSPAQGAAQAAKPVGRPVQRLAQRELAKAGQVLDLPCLLRTFEVLINERMGHRPALGSRKDYADMLLRRGRPEDRERAVALMHEALEAAQDMGVAKLIEDCERLLPSSL